MLFIKELKKICFSIVYILFIGLLLLSWHENFYGVTSKEIQASNGAEASITSQITGGSILAKPEQGGKENLEKAEELYRKSLGIKTESRPQKERAYPAKACGSEPCFPKTYSKLRTGQKEPLF